MEIKASSKYDWETIKKFNRFHSFAKNKVVNIILLIMDIVCAVFFVLECTWGLLDFELIMLNLLLVFVNLILVFALFVLPKLLYNQNKLLHGVVNIISFKDNEMVIEQRGDNTTGSVNVNYVAIWRVYETKENIYIYVNPRQAYIVDKSTIEGVTATDLRIFLTKAVGMSKYKVKCKV